MKKYELLIGAEFPDTGISFKSGEVVYATPVPNTDEILVTKNGQSITLPKYAGQFGSGLIYQETNKMLTSKKRIIGYAAIAFGSLAMVYAFQNKPKHDKAIRIISGITIFTGICMATDVKIKLFKKS